MALTKLRVIFTCDVHGCLFPYDFLKRKGATGSLSRVCTYVKKLRKEYGENLILLDGGDILQGNPSCYYSSFIDANSPNLVASAMNFLGYDGMAIGNHDIETGHAVYDEFIRQLGCSVLAANVTRAESGEPYFLPYTILERDGIRIAVIGMTTQAVPCWQDNELWLGMEFQDIKACTTFWLDKILKTEHPDLTIGIFHSGMTGGLHVGRYKENAVMETVCNTEGLDLVLFGHDHKLFADTLKNVKGNDVLCVNPSSNCEFIGDVEISVERIAENSDVDGLDGCVTKKVKGKLVSLSGICPDNDFMQCFKAGCRLADKFLNRKIGFVAETVRTRDCYFGDAPFSAFIHKIQTNETVADISFAAPLAFDETLEAGPVYVRDAFNLYKYENRIYALRMKGCEVRKYLEYSYDLWIRTMSSPGEPVMKMKRYEYAGKVYTFFENLVFNFDTAAGIDYTVDVTRPCGERISILSMSDGKPFSDIAWYRVAMHSYRGNGGSDFLVEGAGIPFDELQLRVVFKSEHDQRWYIINEFEKQPVVKMQRMNNWKFIPEEWVANAVERDKRELFGNV